MEAMQRLKLLDCTLSIVFCLGALVALYGLPLAVSPDLDFFFFFAQSAALKHGLSLYDEGGQSALLTQTLELGSEGLHINPPAYPPWYYLITAFLGWFDLAASARIWFICNVTMLVTAALLLNPFPSFWGRLAVASACVVFPPSVGLLTVGQLDMPLLLGCALFGSGAKDKKPWWIAFGLFLLSFKPHLGFVPLCVGVFWLILQGGRANWRALSYTLIIFVSAALLSFLVEPGWPIAYARSLQRLSSYKLNVLCDTCSSLTIMAGKLLHWDAAALWRFGIVSLLLALGFAMWVVWKFCRQPGLASFAMAWAVTLTLLVTPYARNYDYVLLLFPILVVLGRAAWWPVWVGLLLSYLWSAVVCIFTERAEHGGLLWVGALIMALVLWRVVSYKDCS